MRTRKIMTAAAALALVFGVVPTAAAGTLTGSQSCSTAGTYVGVHGEQRTGSMSMTLRVGTVAKVYTGNSASFYSNYRSGTWMAQSDSLTSAYAFCSPKYN